MKKGAGLAPVRGVRAVPNVIAFEAGDVDRPALDDDGQLVFQWGTAGAASPLERRLYPGDARP